MTTPPTIPIWQDPVPDPGPGPASQPARRRWVARCDDCKRRIWSPNSVRRRFGRLLGGRCYRKHAAAARRLHISSHIPVRPPGDIPGQVDLLDLLGWRSA